MNADVLREAARLMRERANAATPSDWFEFLCPDSKGSKRGEWIVDAPSRFVCTTNDDSPRCLYDAERIASWHPAVALAVADWLDADAEAHFHTATGPMSVYDMPDMDDTPAVRVARAYLSS